MYMQAPMRYQRMPNPYYSHVLNQNAMLAYGQQQRLAMPPHMPGPYMQPAYAQLSPRQVGMLNTTVPILPKSQLTEQQQQSTENHSALNVPATKVEFLPKAVNVKTPPLTDASAMKARDVATAGSSASSAPQAAHALTSHTLTSHALTSHSYRKPLLRSASRELYNYIMRTEGEEAALKFCENSRDFDIHLHRQQELQRAGNNPGAVNYLHRQQEQAAGMLLSAGALSGQVSAPDVSCSQSSRMLHASELEKRWQEQERLRDHTHPANVTSTRSASPLNPTLQTLTHDDVTMARRCQSPFGNGPQPYSRLNEEQKQEVRQAAADAEAVRACADSPLHGFDSPVSLSPGGSRTKVPLYMRRVGQTSAAPGDHSSSPLPAPRLTYASAVRAPTTTNIDDIPSQTPKTVGPFTPEDNRFFPCRKSESSDVSSEASAFSSASISLDPMEVLKNLKL